VRKRRRSIEGSSKEALGFRYNIKRVLESKEVQ